MQSHFLGLQAEMASNIWALTEHSFPHGLTLPSIVVASPIRLQGYWWQHPCLIHLCTSNACHRACHRVLHGGQINEEDIGRLEPCKQSKVFQQSSSLQWSRMELREQTGGRETRCPGLLAVRYWGPRGKGAAVQMYRKWKGQNLGNNGSKCPQQSSIEGNAHALAWTTGWWYLPEYGAKVLREKNMTTSGLNTWGLMSRDIWEVPQGAPYVIFPAVTTHRVDSANHRSLIDACLLSKIHLSLLRDEMPPALGFCDFFKPGEMGCNGRVELPCQALHGLRSSRVCYSAPYEDAHLHWFPLQWDDFVLHLPSLDDAGCMHPHSENFLHRTGHTFHKAMSDVKEHLQGGEDWLWAWILCL